MKTKVFISRSLEDESPFRSALHGYNVQIRDELLIQFSPIAYNQPQSDWIFFYSRTGVKFFIENGGDLTEKKIGTFGPQTALFFEHYTDIKPDFIGSGEKYDVTERLSQILKKSSCLFVIGKNSLRSVQSIRNSSSDLEVIVYDNKPKEEFNIDPPDIAVFTSPMAARTYFKKYPKRNHSNLAIGQTTLTELLKLNRINSVKSEKASEYSLAQKVIEKLNKVDET